jgi:hypothetical protein
MKTENFLTICVVANFPRISYPMQLLGWVVKLFSFILTTKMYIKEKVKPRNYISVTV